METLPEPLVFEWDEGNSEKNYEKHNVTKREAEEIFASKPMFIMEDERHSLAEQRFMMWGMTKQERRLNVIFTIRKDRVRVISARDMNKKERRAYEEKQIQTHS